MYKQQKTRPKKKNLLTNQWRDNEVLDLIKAGGETRSQVQHTLVFVLRLTNKIKQNTDFTNTSPIDFFAF